MLVAKDNRMVTMTGKELKLFTFRANFNPIYGVEEPELTTIQMPAVDEKHAWDRLGFLLGSQSKINWFRLDEVQDYE